MKKALVLSIMCILLSSLAKADEGNKPLIADTSKKNTFRILQLQSFEDNLVGYTFDSDDKPFVDFTFSARVNIYPFDYLMKAVPKKYRQDLHLNYAFTARMGQYMGTRVSSPVIEKRFNPYLFLEYRPKGKYSNVCVQFGYGHESNGQVIDDSTTFFKTATFVHNTQPQTIDYISRGWDYWGYSVISDFFPKGSSRFSYESGIALKYYLADGILQGRKEEYRSWEQPWSGAAYTRNEVNGLSVSFNVFIDPCFVNRLGVTYETGIAKPLSNSTVKLIAGFMFGNFPIALTYRYGYNADLAQYGKLTNTLGISVILSSFLKPVDRLAKPKPKVETN